LGQTLLDPVLALRAWAEKHRPAVQQARERFDKKQARQKKPLVAAG
jgi:DNA-binding HxlR family transcriptional regulator